MAKNAKNTQEVSVFGKYENKSMCYFTSNKIEYGIMIDDTKNLYPVGSKITLEWTGTIGKSDFAFKVVD